MSTRFVVATVLGSLAFVLSGALFFAYTLAEPCRDTVVLGLTFSGCQTDFILLNRR